MGNYNDSSITSIWDSRVWLSWQSGQGRGSRNSLTGNTFAGDTFPSAQKNLTGPYTTGFMGFAMKLPSGSSASGWVYLCGFLDANTVQCAVQMNTVSGLFRIVRGGTPTVLGTSTAGINVASSAFHYIEFGATINASTGYAELRVDGATLTGLGPLTSQNTKNSGNASFNGWALGSFTGLALTICDFYVCDDSGSSPQNTFLGDTNVIYSRVNGDGGTNQFTIPAVTVARLTAYTVGQFIIDPNTNYQRCTTAGTTAGSAPTYNTSSTTTDGSAVFTFWSVPGHYNFVSDITPDDATAYLSDQTVNDIELHTCASLSGVPTGSTTAVAVCVDIRGERDQSTTRSIRTLVKSSSTTVDNGADLALPNGTWTDFKTIFQLDPNGSIPWTVTAVNACKIGYKVTI
jgi:hypothetical protein